MSFADIVVHLQPRNGAVSHAGAYAISLARAMSSRVTALVYQIVHEPRELDPDAADPAAAEMEEIRGAAARAAEAFRAAALREGVQCEAVAERSYAYGIGEVFADYARVRDLSVLGVSAPVTREERLLFEAALLDSGRPILLAPAHVNSFACDRVLVAWDATPSAVHAVYGAMPFLQAAREVTLTSVLDDKVLRRGASTVEMCRHLARHGVVAVAEAAPRDGREVAVALFNAARSRNADLLVMGGYAHSTLRGMIFGSATKGIVSSPLPLPILLAH